MCCTERFSHSQEIKKCGTAYSRVQFSILSPKGGIINLYLSLPSLFSLYYWLFPFPNLEGSHHFSPS